MWNVIRSQFYQLKKDILAWGVTLLALAATFIMNLDSFEEKMTGSQVTTLMSENMCIMAGMLVLLIIVANVMGKDFMDKTINYEIMSGHTRKDVFFGRLIVATTVGVICSFLVIIAVPVTLTIVNGWGNTMELQGVLIRFSLVFITLFRIAWELAFLTILAKNPYVTYLVGYIFSMVQLFTITVKMNFTDLEISPLLPVANCFNLCTFQDWETFFIDETDKIFYNSAITLETVLWAIIPSIVIGGIMILLSYVFFKHDDLN